ncbi:hypothetical protein LUZ63_013414 [Rhynchospora breviuscula]|uniref:F-box domain-containing protein n=1 Tax=Rhynchospora breviuscula TaxID=2022672 RepID=A0A9Q0C8I0_9POAL|nr:hypothetical protein LUZ63_013414 [Rhynchospora breviuscula]
MADEVDFLSILPDDVVITILSFLPSAVAVRTSILCRRFRHLWEASPSVLLTPRYLPRPNNLSFLRMGERVILQRHPSHPILSLHLEFRRFTPPLRDQFIYFMLVKAQSLGLRHLTIHESPHDLVYLLPSIFSIDSLESLDLPTIGPFHARMFHSGFTSTCFRLTTLSLRFFNVASFNISRILPQLPSLEDLRLEIRAMDCLSLPSQTIRKLKLIIIGADDPKFESLALSLPSLESLHLETRGPFSFSAHCPIHGEFPLLKKTVIILDEVHAPDATAVMRLLHSISHVQELSLHVKEEKYPIPNPILLEPGKTLPDFPRLKHLDVSLCFHDRNFDAIIMVLRNCPALESLKLVHKIPKFTDWAQGRKRKDWRSELPRNADGNRRYAYFTNLHLGKNKKEFMKFLAKKCTFWRRAKDLDV